MRLALRSATVAVGVLVIAKLVHYPDGWGWTDSATVLGLALAAQALSGWSLVLVIAEGQKGGVQMGAVLLTAVLTALAMCALVWTWQQPEMAIGAQFLVLCLALALAALLAWMRMWVATFEIAALLLGAGAVCGGIIYAVSGME